MVTVLSHFPLFGQTEPAWCWAASIQMVLAWLRGDGGPDQALIANTGSASSPRVDCRIGANRRRKECGLSDLAQPLDRNGVAYKFWAPDTATFQLIASEIKAGRPVLAEVSFSSATALGKHAVVIVGVDESAQLLRVHNPDPIGVGSRCWISDRCLRGELSLGGVYGRLRLQQAKASLAAPPAKGKTIAARASRSLPKRARRAAEAILPHARRLASSAASKLALAPTETLHVFDLPPQLLADERLAATLAQLVDPARRAHVPSRVLVPLQLAGAVVSVVEVVPDKVGGDADVTWSGCCIGDTGTFQLLYDTRKGDASAHRVSAADYVGIAAPSIGVWLVGTRKGKDAVFVPVISVPRGRLRAGERYDAATVARSLARVAALV